MSFVYATLAASQKRNALPVPIFSHRPQSLGGCYQGGNHSQSALSALPLNLRSVLLKRLFANFGRVLATAHFQDFYYFDEFAGEFKNFGKTCGAKFGGLNPFWLVCMR